MRWAIQPLCQLPLPERRGRWVHDILTERLSVSRLKVCLNVDSFGLWESLMLKMARAPRGGVGPPWP
jgi:hypothetical protein